MPESAGAAGAQQARGGRSLQTLLSSLCPLCAPAHAHPRRWGTASPALAVQLPSALRAHLLPKAPLCSRQLGRSSVSTSTTCAAGEATCRGHRAQGCRLCCRWRGSCVPCGSQREWLPARPREGGAGRVCRCQHFSGWRLSGLAAGCPAPPTSRPPPRRGRARAQEAGLRLRVVALPAPRAFSPLAVGLCPAGTSTWECHACGPSFWGDGVFAGVLQVPVLSGLWAPGGRRR